MLKRIPIFAIMLLTMVVLVKHKPHFNMSVDDSNGLYDADIKNAVSFEPPLFSDADYSDIDEDSILGQAMHMTDKVEDKGGLVGYVAQTTTDRMQDSLDSAMGNFNSALDAAMNEYAECE